jgi:RNA polymerase sigma-70 factor (ECF subfamily)
MMLASHEVTMPMREDQLVARCRAGDLDALGQVYALYERQVFRYAYHLLGHREDADDVKQETFLRAYQSIGSFRNHASLLTWLLKICGNLCRDRVRSWERRKIIYDSGIAAEEVGLYAQVADPCLVVERAHTTEIILSVLRELPTAQREIIILHEVEGLDHKEVAAILGCSPACAKVRLFRARRSLKERVAAHLKV